MPSGAAVNTLTPYKQLRVSCLPPAGYGQGDHEKAPEVDNGASKMPMFGAHGFHH